MPLIKYI
ncbi:uncharacterized protein FFNC_06264 [Fusarium fujikuroi]|nr:uncharacterized protein FFNC_06264 [Fusarium fujikuroi]